MIINEMLGGQRVEIESGCCRFGIYAKVRDEAQLQGEGNTLREALVDAIERGTCWDSLDEMVGDRAYQLFGVEYLNTRGAMLGEEPTQEDEKRLHEMEEKAFESLDDLELFDAIRDGDLSCFIDWKEKALEEAKRLYEEEANEVQQWFIEDYYKLNDLERLCSLTWLDDELREWALNDVENAYDEDCINYYLDNTSEVDDALDDFEFNMRDYSTPYEALIEAGRIGLSISKYETLCECGLVEEFNNLVEEWEGF